MAHNDAIEVLFRERERLVTERDTMLRKFSSLISGIETSIETLSGKTVWETEQGIVYDDQNPDYIKSTEDGI